MQLPLRLSQQQLQFFDTFGFLAFPGLMADRVDQIIAEFEPLWASRGVVTMAKSMTARRDRVLHRSSTKRQRCRR